MNELIVGVDGSEAAERAAVLAADLAKAQGAQLELVHVLVPPVMAMEVPAYATSRVWVEQRSWADNHLAELARKLGGRAKANVLMVIGSPAHELVDRSKAISADLIVVGSSGAGMAERLLLGSTAHKVVHLAKTPVLVVRQQGATAMKKFFVAVDESSCAAKAARVTAHLAAGLGGELVLVYVSQPNLIPDIPKYHSLLAEMEHDEETRVAGVLQGIKAELGPFNVAVTAKRLTGSAETFIDWAEQQGADCLAVGSRGRNAVARVMLGSFADRVLNASKRHVLVVR